MNLAEARPMLRDIEGGEWGILLDSEARGFTLKWSSKSLAKTGLNRPRTELEAGPPQKGISEELVSSLVREKKFFFSSFHEIFSRGMKERSSTDMEGPEGHILLCVSYWFLKLVSRLEQKEKGNTVISKVCFSRHWIHETAHMLTYGGLHMCIPTHNV